MMRIDAANNPLLALESNGRPCGIAGIPCSTGPGSKESIEDLGFNWPRQLDIGYWQPRKLRLWNSGRFCRPLVDAEAR
jgi:hypothetical protein